MKCFIRKCLNEFEKEFLKNNCGRISEEIYEQFLKQAMEDFL